MPHARGRAHQQPRRRPRGEDRHRHQDPSRREPEEEARLEEGPVLRSGRDGPPVRMARHRPRCVHRHHRDERPRPARRAEEAEVLHRGPARHDDRQGRRGRPVLRHVREHGVGHHRMGEGETGIPGHRVPGREGPRMRRLHRGVGRRPGRLPEAAEDVHRRASAHPGGRHQLGGLPERERDRPGRRDHKELRRPEEGHQGPVQAGRLQGRGPDRQPSGGREGVRRCDEGPRRLHGVRAAPRPAGLRGPVAHAQHVRAVQEEPEGPRAPQALQGNDFTSCGPRRRPGPRACRRRCTCRSTARGCRACRGS